MTRVEVGPTEAFDPGDREIVDTDDGEIGVFNVDGEYFALENQCPHRGGPVCTGKVDDAIVGEWPGVGERPVMTYDDEPAVTCPWHGWDFYLESGDHVGFDGVSVPTYQTTVEDGTLFVEL